MPVKNGLQRTLYKGIPVWMNDVNDMFIYGIGEQHVKIGDSKGFFPNWKEVYSEFLKSFRGELVSRSRAKKN
jgi:hypothetical protein